MKVVHVLDNRSGGLLHYTSQLVNALSRRCEVCLIAPIGIDRQHFKPDIRIVELHIGSTQRECIADTVLFPRFLRYLHAIRRERPDIVHIQEHPVWLGLTAPILSRMYPVVTTVHDVYPHLGERAWDQHLGRLLFSGHTDAVFVHGEWAKKALSENEDYHFGDTVHSIPMGHFGLFRACTRAAAREEPGTVLFFGRIEEYKGIPYLLEAMHLLESRLCDARLILAGDGDLRPYQDLLERASNIEIQNRFIPDEEVAALFQRAKVVVLPYVECTQTGVVPIAYAFKKPVVVTRTGSIPELVEEGRTGLIVPSRDSRALADAIERLLRDESARLAMGEEGYTRLTGDMSWDRIAEMTLDVYRKVLRIRRSGDRPACIG